MLTGRFAYVVYEGGVDRKCEQEVWTGGVRTGSNEKGMGGGVDCRDGYDVVDESEWMRGVNMSGTLAMVGAACFGGCITPLSGREAA